MVCVWKFSIGKILNCCSTVRVANGTCQLVSETCLTCFGLPKQREHLCSNSILCVLGKFWNFVNYQFFFLFHFPFLMIITTSKKSNLYVFFEVSTHLLKGSWSYRQTRSAVLAGDSKGRRSWCGKVLRLLPS